MDKECYGCSINSMSQLDHMDCGGCLHNIEDCEYCLIIQNDTKTDKI